MDRKLVTKKFKSGAWGYSYDYDAIVYSNPENCGLKIVASVEEEPNYSFDIVVLFQDIETGSLWLCHDAGCSCPTPFEDVKSFADMTPVRSERQIDAFVDQFAKFDDSYHEWNRAEVAEFKRKARKALRTQKKEKA